MNFITAHDGFTLQDLVSYNDKHNEANGEDNRDGHSDNLSWNHGVEGPTDDPDILELRDRQKRNLLSTLLLAQGTPMLLAGDEFGRTQQGNNNAYCQDNEICWVDWNIDDFSRQLIDFVRKLIGIRNAFPILRRNRFLLGEYNQELDVYDVRWLTPSGTDMSEQWDDPMPGASACCWTGARRRPALSVRPWMRRRLLVLNAHHDVVNFKLPEVVGGKVWRRLIDTNQPDAEGSLQVETGEKYQITARSVLLFAVDRDQQPSVALRRARQALRDLAETPAVLPSDWVARVPSRRCPHIRWAIEAPASCGAGVPDVSACVGHGFGRDTVVKIPSLQPDRGACATPELFAGVWRLGVAEPVVGSGIFIPVR